MTARQLEAIETLERCGKMVQSTIKRHGFAVRTYEALADDGYILRETRRGVPTFLPLASPRHPIDTPQWNPKR